MSSEVRLSSRPAIGFIGAGRVARCLAEGWKRAGYVIGAVSSRSGSSARALAANVGCAAVADAQQVIAQADIVFLTVGDDAIGPAAAQLRYAPGTAAGKALVHCSGASAVTLLDPARQQGVQTGAFHPLCLFSGSAADLERLAGCSVTIEAPDTLRAALQELARVLHCKPLDIPAGERMLYHAAAHYAASFLLCSLAENVALWARLGLDERQTLDAVWPMLQGTLQSAREKGLAGALAGPVSRGDAGIVRQQLDTLGQLGGDHAQLYALMTRRAVALARRREQAPPALDEIDAAASAALGKPAD